MGVDNIDTDNKKTYSFSAIVVVSGHDILTGTVIS